MPNRLEILKNDAQLGDKLSIYLLGGEPINGLLLEINDDNVVLDVDGKQKRIFSQMIGGWDVIKKVHAPSDNHVDDEKGTEEDSGDDHKYYENGSYEREEMLSMIDRIYQKENVELSHLTTSNAQVEMISPTGVMVKTDKGITLTCNKVFIVGFSRANCVKGKRIFCGNSNDQGFCYNAVLEMTYEELRLRFIAALNSKPLPRIPIIKSIVSYFRTNHHNSTTKKITKDLLDRIKNLSNPGQNNIIKEINDLVSKKKLVDAFQLIDSTIQKTSDSKLKSSLLLRKAQLYSSQREIQLAIDAYLELIKYNENINSPANNLSHLYTEVARLYLLFGNEEEAIKARNKSLELNPNNKIARQMEINGDIPIVEGKEKEEVASERPKNIVKAVSLTKKKLLDDDVDRHQFIDSEISSLNGMVTDSIANRLLEESIDSADVNKYLETAKALKSLPEGSYNVQDYEDTLSSYAVLRCRGLYSSITKIIQETEQHTNISIEQIIKQKDCAVSYYLETIERFLDDDKSFSELLLRECLKMEMAVFAFGNEHNNTIACRIIETNEIEKCCLNLSKEYIIRFIRTVCFYSVRCSKLWDNLLINSSILIVINSFLSENIGNRLLFINSYETPSIRKSIMKYVNIDGEFLFEKIVLWECKRLNTFHEKLKQVEDAPFDILSLSSLRNQIKTLKKTRYSPCLNKTDIKSIQEIESVISILVLYESRDEEQRKQILSNATLSINKLISWNSVTTTSLGRFYFTPLLIKWQEAINKLIGQKQTKKLCFLSLSFDPPFFTEENGEKKIRLVISNYSQTISEGYRLALWAGNDRKKAIVLSNNKDIFPNNTVSIECIIPKEKWGDSEIYEVQYALDSRYMNEWSFDLLDGVTITKRKDVTFSIRDIKWHDQGDVSDEMFKGRTEIVNSLSEHYCSKERYYSYVLYGLSRTGKSCILKHLKKAIIGKIIVAKDGSNKTICPIYIDLGAVHGVSKTKEKFWDKFLKRIKTEVGLFSQSQHISTIEIPESLDFDNLVHFLNERHVHPLFMFDEFSYMKAIIDDNYMNSAFLQCMRGLAADDDMASFIFAGTYDIKVLIHDEHYNISGAFNYLKEPKKPIFEISKESAEELISAMGDLLIFTKPAIEELHRLTGDVPYWIQKLCLNCAFYAVENHCSTIGLNELNDVVKVLTGETVDLSDETHITPMTSTIFDMTQTQPTDPPEVKLILTSMAYLIKRDKLVLGVSYSQLLSLWNEYGFDCKPYKISETIQLLLERGTLCHNEKDDIHYYNFSLSLFRRWWSRNHYDIYLELASFKKK